MDTIVIDLDDTMSKTAMVEGGSPLRDVCLLAELLGDHPLVNQGAIRLFLFSGDPETRRKEIEDWLLVHARSTFQKAEGLLMREASDARHEVYVKSDMLEDIKSQGYDVRFVVTTRKYVIEMMKEKGLTVLHTLSRPYFGGI
jgi:hypothetical protein